MHNNSNPIKKAGLLPQTGPEALQPFTVNQAGVDCTKRHMQQANLERALDFLKRQPKVEILAVHVNGTQPHIFIKYGALARSLKGECYGCAHGATGRIERHQALVHDCLIQWEVKPNQHALKLA